MSYTHFTLTERFYLQELLNQKKSFREIAKEMNRSPSTISREVRRNWSKKKNRYNPFILLYGGMPKKELLASMEIALKNELCSVESAIELIDFENEIVQNIICNILYIGCPAKVKAILCGTNEKKKEKNRKDGLIYD